MDKDRCWKKPSIYAIWRLKMSDYQVTGSDRSDERFCELMR
jgi:hypothetical protein